MHTPSITILPLACAGGAGPAARTARIPQLMDEASTHSSILHTTTPGQDRSKWIYYRLPVRNYLKGLGCCEQDLDDLTHDTLIKLQTYILLNYDRERPFRPYFKVAIRNFYFDRLRGTRLAPVNDPPRQADEESEFLVGSLLEFARQIYEHFAVEAHSKLERGVAMLHLWLMENVNQEELAQRWNLSDRQVRTQIGRAADALTDWMQSKINQSDLTDLARIAREQGIVLDFEIAGIRGLLSHLSRRKRVRVLLVLALIYRGRIGLTQQVPTSPLLRECRESSHSDTG